MARLKVFAATIGFFDTVVAAPSRKAALEAWGARQDLFGEGLASVTDDPAAETAALAHPGVVLRRAPGSKGGFEQAPALPDPPEGSRPKSAAKPAARPARSTPAPDRRPLDRAQAALEKIEARYSRDHDALEREMAALGERLKALEQSHVSARHAAVRRRDQALRAFRRAGGKDA